MSKTLHDVRKIRHDVKKFVMTSNILSWSQKHPMTPKSSSGRQKHVIMWKNTSKVRHVMPKKVRHHVKNTSWCQEVRNDVKNTSWRQKVHYVKMFVMTSQTRHDVKKFVMTSKSTWRQSCLKCPTTKYMKSKSSSLCQKHVMTSKSSSICQKHIMMSKTLHDVKNFEEVRHDVKN